MAIRHLIGAALFLLLSPAGLALAQPPEFVGLAELWPAGGGLDGAPMVLVPAGEFLMGSEDGDNDEKPVRQVYLDAFYIDTYEVTNARYDKFLRATGRTAPDYWNDRTFNEPSQPVVGVSWYDADAYCRWAGKRLPTEAEWEKAARGTDGRRYPWGDGWDKSRANTGDGGPGKPAPVGSYEGGKGPYGAYDMAGNVWEWVADWYDPNASNNTSSRNPQGPELGRAKVLRGSSWNSFPHYARTAFRYRYNPDTWYANFGVRCAKAP